MAKLRPLFTPAKPATARNVNAPIMVSSVPNNAVTLFDDFYSSSIANIGFSVGTLATPDTLTHISPLGGPSWQATEFSGTTGSVAQTPGTSAFLGLGSVNLNTGTTVTNSVGLDLGGTTTQGLAAFYLSNTQPAIGLWRFQWPSNLLTQDFGIGWVAFTTVPTTTNWLTDPDTALAGGGTNIVFTKHVASYALAAAGDLMCRIYDANGLFNTNFVVAEASTLANATAYKLEVASDGTDLRVYLNGVQVGATVTMTGLTSAALRPSVRTVNTTAAARTVAIDCYYQELGQATAR